MCERVTSDRSQIRLAVMLGALTMVFVLSHAFRTMVAVAADPLAADLDASASALGAIAGAFHFAFAIAQPAVGVALDRYGAKRTVVVAFVLSMVGSAVSATAPNVAVLIAGQWLIGFGCAPALLAAMVFISQRYRSERFASLSGIVLSVGGAGMLMTGTPLAWVIDTWSWRVGFISLGLLSAASWIAVLWLVDDQRISSDAHNQTLASALRGLSSIVRKPYAAGICALAATSYAAFLALRGLWLGPMFAERYAFSVLEIGHLALAVSIAGMLGPLVFGLTDPGDRARRVLIISCSAAYVLLFAVHAFGAGVFLDIALVVFNGFLAGYITLQYADLRSAYPPEMTGRALSVFTMAMFLGVAGMQWLSGLAAELAPEVGIDPVDAALISVCVVLSIGTLAFWLLPGPPNLRRPNRSRL